MGGSELRKHKRVRFSDNVVVNESMTTRAASLSEGGMFLYTGQPFQAENEVAVAFAVDRAAMSMKGVVRHFQNDVGIGVTFLNPTEEQRALLARFIELAAQTQPDLSGAVLLVDNNQSKRERYKAALTHSGFVVREAGTDEDALAICREQSVKVVVFDPHIPNGYTLLKRIRMTPEGRGIIPIVLASRPIPDDKKRMYLHSVPEFAMKMTTSPARLQQLVAKHYHP